MLPMQIDHAMAQTMQTGAKYIAIPLPWLTDWIRHAVDRKGSRFEWWKVCMGGGNNGFIDRPELLDGNGNIILCLLERDHDGPCASEVLGLVS